MKKIRKGTKFMYTDNIERKVIDVEKYNNCDYVCYYIYPPFNDKDDFFEKGSPTYNNILNILNK